MRIHSLRIAAILLAAAFAATAASWAQLPPLNSNPGNAAGVVNVNTAPRETLMLLYRTSGKMADQIIAERTEEPFKDAESLRTRVKGASPTWFNVNAPHVVYTGESNLTHRIRRPPTNSLPSFPSAPGLS